MSQSKKNVLGYLGGLPMTQSQEEKLSYLGPLIKQGLKPKEIEKKLREDPEAPFRFAASTISNYSTEWRRRNGILPPVPIGFQKQRAESPSQKEENPMAEEKKPQTKEPEAPPKPTETPADKDGEWREQFKGFCEMFPEQCQAMVSDLKKGLSQELSQIGNRVSQDVKATMAEFGKPSPKPEPHGEEPEEEKSPSEKEMLMVPPATYVQWLRGHLEVCPTCRGMGEELITPLKGCLSALGCNDEKEAEHEGPDQGGGEGEEQKDPPPGDSRGATTDSRTEQGGDPTEEPKSEAPPPDASLTTEPGEPSPTEPTAAEPSDAGGNWKPW